MPDYKTFLHSSGDGSQLEFSQYGAQKAYKEKAEGICGGVVAKFATNFFAVPYRPRKTLSPKDSDVFKQFLNDCWQLQQELITSQGDIDQFMWSIFGCENVEMNVKNTLDDMLTTCQASGVEKNAFFICLNEIFETPTGEKVSLRHLIGLFRYRDHWIFIEPNYGIRTHNSYEAFNSWINQESTDGILSFYKRPSDKTVGLDNGKLVKGKLFVESFTVYSAKLQEKSLNLPKAELNTINRPQARM